MGNGASRVAATTRPSIRRPQEALESRRHGAKPHQIEGHPEKSRWPFLFLGVMVLVHQAGCNPVALRSMFGSIPSALTEARNRSGCDN